MEQRVTRTVNGQELRNQDLTIIADDAALADDHVLWELLRLTPGSATPDRGILPYAVRGAGIPALGDGFAAAMHNTALVQGGTSNGSVRVMPFRAVIGSTTLFATSPTEKLRGIRSGYHVGASSMYSTVAIAANATGNPRWTLVYAIVTPDADGDTVAVKTKDPSSGNVSTGALVLNKRCTVTVTTTDGTAAANPVRPSLPVDGAGNYYIAIAYILVPNGFGASSSVLFSSIHESAPVLTMSPATGTKALGPASEQYRINGVCDLAQNPNRNAAKRTGAYLPSTMVGGDSIFILLQLGLSPVSHANGAIVDSSRDWRQRYFTWSAFVASGTTSVAAFASDGNGTGAAGADTRAPSALASGGAGGPGVNTMTGWGQSMGFNDYPAGAVATCSGVAFALGGNSAAANATIPACTALGATGATVLLYVESTTGNLIIKLIGSPSGQVLIKLDATAQFSNVSSF